jgi:hypothetical protein
MSEDKTGTDYLEYEKTGYIEDAPPEGEPSAAAEQDEPAADAEQQGAGEQPAGEFDEDLQALCDCPYIPPPKIEKQGLLEQVLAQYNSRPPALINRIAGHPVQAASGPAAANLGLAFHTLSRPAVTDPFRAVYTACKPANRQPYRVAAPPANIANIAGAASPNFTAPRICNCQRRRG